MKAKRVALYARVSTDDQTVENQLLVLRKVAELRDRKVYKEYSDNGYTGNSGRDKRPGLDDLLSDAERGKIDVIAGFAEFERDLIIERTKAGLERARAKGKKLGRPFTIGEEKKAEVRRLRATGIGVNKIAKATRVAPGTVIRILREAA